MKGRRPNKPRKPIGGDVARKLERVGTVHREIARERQRHKNAIAGFAAQRDAARLIADLGQRESVLAALRHRTQDEYDRHRFKIDELERRAREIWR